MVGLASAIALAHAVLLGVPSILALNYLDRLRLPYVVPVSFLIGALPIPVLLPAIGNVSWSLPEMILSMGVCGLVGAIAGAVWFFAAGLPSNKSLERSREP